MKKDRNAFFQEASMSASGYLQNPAMMNPNMYQNPYAAQQMPNNGMAPMPINNTASANTEYDSRLSKIERQINRMEVRLSKLESLSGNIGTIDDSINNSSMYMI
jgi:hypothetical protein